MNVLVIGSGAREHALVWKLARSPRVSRLFASPGNPGMSEYAELLASAQDPASLTALALRHAIDLVVIGPEQPLVDGLVDSLTAAGIRAFGPHRAAAALEGSKRFAKQFMLRHGIPTARAEAFTDEAAALDFLQTVADPPVVKRSGLAAGKGVTVADSLSEAEEAVRAAFRDPSSGGVVLEERLQGRELSLLGVTDGTAWLPLKLAQDYKYLSDGDTGPMTGGMGAVAPAELLDDEQLREVNAEIVSRTLAGIRAEGLAFTGVLFIGLMVTPTGVKVLEYNVRLGDPETQVVLPLLETDLLDVIDAAHDGTLSRLQLSWKPLVAAGVVLAAPGYPGSPQRGVPLQLPAGDDGLLVFQAGTELSGGQLLSRGGRVLSVVALAPDLEAARDRAYEAVRQTGFAGAQWRSDIGLQQLLSEA